MKKEVGQVSEGERDVIKAIFERKNGLVELAKIISPDNEGLYEKLIRDLSHTNQKFEEWWQEMSCKYNWEFETDSHWEIDFDSCKVFLI